MKTIAAILLLSCCALGQDKAAVSAAKGACGPQDAEFEVVADDSQHPTATPEDGKALIYVVHETAPGTTRFGLDGKWLGALKPGTYFFSSIDPGERHLCAISRIGLSHHVSLHDLKAEAGKTYYFVTRFTNYGPDSLALNEVNSDEGKYLVGTAKLSVSHPK